MPKPLRVAVVSVHPLTRAGLTHLLGADARRAAVVETVAMDGDLGANEVVVYDLSGLGATGEGDLQHLLAHHIRVLGVVPLHRPDLVEGALAIGVADVVPVSVGAPQLLNAVERVAAGQVADRGQRLSWSHKQLRKATRLTERELEIVQLIATGRSNQAIADHLFLSINSIKTYIRTAYRKIGVGNRSEAVLWAVRHHLVQPARVHHAVDTRVDEDGG